MPDGVFLSSTDFCSADERERDVDRILFDCKAIRPGVQIAYELFGLRVEIWPRRIVVSIALKRPYGASALDEDVASTN